MGLRTVAIYVDADADAPFVSEGEVAVRVDSYMDPAAVVAAALVTGAEAVHPGYGFLSENAGFAQAVTDAGLRWIGPSPTVIAAMGDKLEAKKRAVAADVPTLPSSEDPSDGASVGYPLLVKAAAGGGGKGMRVVHDPADLAESVAAAQREALNGFGDETVFLERYVPKARHVEIQIMGDAHGTVVAHGERECSIQRRHQKIVEEAPSPGISAETRLAMEAAAIRLGSEIGYESAGTVEFLVDDSTGEFFFLEVNTRLQVEHPVTEEARNIDLVREQLQVAMGSAASPATDAVAAAIEVRLYAEDAASDFLPAIGTLDALAVPEVHNADVRWDLGVTEGSEVTINFDPMLGKVTASGPDRAEAARRLASALERLHLGGVITNRDFLVNVLRSPEFLAGDTTTDFIERVAPSPALDLCEGGLETAMFVGALWLREHNRAADGIWGNLPAGFRTGRMPPTSVTLHASEPFFATPVDDEDDEARTQTIAYQPLRDGSVSIGAGRGALTGEAVMAIDRGDAARVHSWSPREIEIEIGGVRQRHRITARTVDSARNSNVDRLWVQMPMGTVELVIAPRFVVPGSEGPSGGFVAPMPGVVLDMRVAPGDAVTKGQTLVILEAMKMEHHMNAAEDGVVDQVFVNAGDQVVKDAVLLTMVDEEATDG